MAFFKYKAVDADGKPVEGIMEEASANRVTTLLSEQGFQVNLVEPAVKRRGLPQLKGRLSWRDLELFNQQLSAVANSGLPLAESLKAVAGDIPRPKLRAAFDAVRGEIESGSTLSEALTKHATEFPDIYVSMVCAGEHAGNLPGVLLLLDSYIGRMIETRNRLHIAVAYPLLVVVSCLALLGFLLLRVVPQFEQIFMDFGKGLPEPTRFLCGLSRLLVNHGETPLIFLVVLVVTVFVIRTALRQSEAGRAFLERIMLNIPFISHIRIAGSLGRFCRSLGLLLASRAPAVEALDLAGAASGSAILHIAARKAAEAVSAGQRMADALRGKAYFGERFCWFLATGEERGQADEALLQLADAYERELGSADRVLVTLIGPALVVAVGFMVGFIVLSLYLPIFTLGDAISGG